MKSNHRDPLDLIIDGALSHYAGAEPLAGIEQRVLTRIRSSHAGHPGYKLLGWVIACPILLAALFIMIARWIPAAAQPGLIISASLPHVGAPANALTIPRKVAPQRLRRSRATPLHPSISPEERMLLALVQSHLTESGQLFADMRWHGEEPVAVPEIEIAPLQIPEVE